MNINYDEIIHRANARAEKLKALTEQFEPIHEKAEQLIDALLYFERLEANVRELDSEGQALLPNYVVHRLLAVGACVRYALAQLVRQLDAQRSDSAHVLELVKAVKGAA